MEKDEILFYKRIKELSDAAYYRGYPVYSDFLNMNEISIFLNKQAEFSENNYRLWGGYDDAERKVLCFYPKDYEMEPDFQFSCIEIVPANPRFSDKLTHRDYLGAILNLGIDRSKVGDILMKDQTAYVFSDSVIADFIVDNLLKIKHTNVRTKVVTIDNISITPDRKEITGSIAANRLDCLIALAFQSSRSSITKLISSGKVYVNGRLTMSNSCIIKEDDVISVRGFGKFMFKGIKCHTKKGRLFATILKYI